MYAVLLGVCIDLIRISKKDQLRKLLAQDLCRRADGTFILCLRQYNGLQILLGAFLNSINKRHLLHPPHESSCNAYNHHKNITFGRDISMPLPLKAFTLYRSAIGRAT